MILVSTEALGSLLLLYPCPLRMTPHKLVATDIVHAIPLALVAGTGYLIAGKVYREMLMSLLLGSVPTMILGSILAKKASSRILQLLYFIAGRPKADLTESLQAWRAS